MTEDVVRAYRSDGAVCVRNVINQRWLDVLAMGIQRNLDNPGWQSRVYTKDRGEVEGYFFGDAAVWQDIPEYEDFIFNSPAAEMAARLTAASRINIYFDGCFVRAPHTPSRTPWHHDVPYWPHRGRPDVQYLGAARSHPARGKRRVRA